MEKSNLSAIILISFLTMTFLGCQQVTSQGGMTSQGNDCRMATVKYISTFRSSRMWKVMGGDAKWNLSSVKECNDIAKQGEKALFFLPVLLYQIKDYYQRENWTNDEKKLAQEVSKYFATTLENENLNISNTDDNAFCIGLNKLTQEFYSLCEDDKVFYQMIYTMDDGPFFGIDTDLTLPIKDSLEIEDINAKIYLREQGDTSTIELLDHNGQTKWKKIIARSPTNYISSVGFANEPIRDQNELGYKIGLFGSGEFIHLYLRTDGAFRLYFHSW